MRLDGGRSVVVDAKVPLDAYLDAMEPATTRRGGTFLSQHVRQVRRMSTRCRRRPTGGRSAGTPEFVVLFVPADTFLAAALESDPTLLEYASTRNVVLATPATLIALLRTVAYGWTRERWPAQRAPCTRSPGSSTRGCPRWAITSPGSARPWVAPSPRYNKAVGSLEARVLVTARQFEDIGVTRESLATVQPVEQIPAPTHGRRAARCGLPGAPRTPAKPLRRGPGPGESRRSSA